MAPTSNSTPEIWYMHSRVQFFTCLLLPKIDANILVVFKIASFWWNKTNMDMNKSRWFPFPLTLPNGSGRMARTLLKTIYLLLATINERPSEKWCFCCVLQTRFFVWCRTLQAWSIGHNRCVSVALLLQLTKSVNWLYPVLSTTHARRGDYTFYHNYVLVGWAQAVRN